MTLKPQNMQEVKRNTPQDTIVKKWCGSCGALFLAAVNASYCIECGKRSLDYRCDCGRKHAGGMPCHCEKPVQQRNVDQYQTVNLSGSSLADFYGENE